MIWRKIIEDRVETLERQFQELRGTLAHLLNAPGTHAGGHRNYLNLMNKYLSSDDIRELAFQHSIDYEDLDGENARGKTLSLVQEMERQGRLYQLEQAVRKMRPGVDWPPFV